MSRNGIIRRRDRQPLGSLEQVKNQIGEAFPGTRFILERGRGDIQPSGFSLVALLFRLFKVQYPYWEGSFEGGQFIAVFNLGVKPTVDAVRVTLYGRGSTGANAHFVKLSKQTGWQIKL